MLKDFVQTALRRFGYRIQRVPPSTYRPHPNFDEADYQQALSIIQHPQSAAGARWGKYLSRRRMMFYLYLADVLAAAGIDLNGQRVLDIGTFFGDGLYNLHKRWPNGIYFGTETEDARLAVTRERCPWAEVFNATIATLPDQSYDVVLLTEVLEHLEEPDEALQKLLSITRKFLVLTVPDGRYDTHDAHRHKPEWQAYIGHINFWSPESWRRWLQRTAGQAEIQTGKLSTEQLWAIIRRSSSVSGISHSGVRRIDRPADRVVRTAR
jgi:SAM-dependent methyltransferase